MTTTPEALPLTGEDLRYLAVDIEAPGWTCGRDIILGLLATIAAEKAKAGQLAERVGHWVKTVEAKESENATLSAKLAVCVEALRECAEDLGQYVESHYEKTKDYPSELRRYERDIEPVKKARAVLADLPQSAASLLARLEKMEGNQRTVGTMEVCEVCHDDLCVADDCNRIDCPFITALPGVG